MSEIPLEYAILLSIGTFVFALIWSFMMASRVAPPRAKKLIVETLSDPEGEEVLAIRAALVAPELDRIRAEIPSKQDLVDARAQVDELAKKALTLDFFLSEDEGNQAVLADVMMAVAAAVQLRLAYELSPQGKEGPKPMTDFVKTFGDLLAISVAGAFNKMEHDVKKDLTALAEREAGGDELELLNQAVAEGSIKPETAGKMKLLFMGQRLLERRGQGSSGTSSPTQAPKRRPARPGGAGDAFYG